MKKNEKVTNAYVGRAIHVAIERWSHEPPTSTDYRALASQRADVIESLIRAFCPEAKENLAVAKKHRAQWECDGSHSDFIWD